MHTACHNGVTYAVPESVVQEAMVLKKESRSHRSLIEICMDIAPEKVELFVAPKAPLRDALLDFAFPEGISPQDLRTLESILKEYGHA